MMATALLLVLMAAATATDLRWHKIYNWLTYPAILAGLGLGAAGSIAIAMGGVAESQWRASGHATLGESALGLLVCGLVMLLCLVFFPVGGGDVKLMAALGAIAGPEDGITAMLWTFVLGGCAAL
ncbi:MAG: prepilin peptidase, partial [Planctomycetota bacterium]